MKKIFWVASYPRSGNTWMRAILSSLFFAEEGKFNFNLLNHIRHFENADKYDFVRTLSMHDFSKLNELPVIAKYWLEAQERINISEDFAFFKTHSGNVTLNKHKYTNEENVLGLIYMVRDPRDVVVSYSKYLNKSIDDIIATITNKNAVAYSGLRGKGLYPFLLGSWDIHYRSWRVLDVPRLVIKYETLLKETKQTINQIADFFVQNYGFDFKNIETKINNILETTSFGLLLKSEKQQGFNEAPYFFSKKGSADYFFRKGKDRQWEKELTSAQLNKIEDSFEATMKELGYLE